MFKKKSSLRVIEGIGTADKNDTSEIIQVSDIIEFEPNITRLVLEKLQSELYDVPAGDRYRVASRIFTAVIEPLIQDSKVQNKLKESLANDFMHRLRMNLRTTIQETRYSDAELASLDMAYPNLEQYIRNETTLVNTVVSQLTSLRENKEIPDSVFTDREHVIKLLKTFLSGLYPDGMYRMLTK